MNQANSCASFWLYPANESWPMECARLRMELIRRIGISAFLSGPASRSSLKALLISLRRFDDFLDVSEDDTIESSSTIERNGVVCARHCRTLLI